MNRAQQRKFVRAARKKGVDKSVAELYLRVKNHGSVPQRFEEGDKVRLNVERIRKHPDYGRLSSIYREFVESHVDDIFTVAYDARRKENPTEVCLKEDRAGWLFWTGDLVRAD